MNMFGETLLLKKVPTFHLDGKNQYDKSFPRKIMPIINLAIRLVQGLLDYNFRTTIFPNIVMLMVGRWYTV